MTKTTRPKGFRDQTRGEKAEDKGQGRLTYREMCTHLATSVHTTNLLVSENGQLRQEREYNIHLVRVFQTYVEDLGGTAEDFSTRFNEYMAQLTREAQAIQPEQPKEPREPTILGV